MDAASSRDVPIAFGSSRSMIGTRWSTCADAGHLARIHGDAWRFTYAGLVPGLALERMIAARGSHWWQAMHRAGQRALLVEMDGRVAGYATLGRCRSRDLGQRGEIYELYLDPVCHGAGLGKRLFEDARRHLAARALDGLIVWSLARNEIGCRFYRALGGRPEARGHTRLGGVCFERIGFAWP